MVLRKKQYQEEKTDQVKYIKCPLPAFDPLAHPSDHIIACSDSQVEIHDRLPRLYTFHTKSGAKLI